MSETRQEKAQRLVDQGRVELGHIEHNVVSGLVSSKGARYQVFVFVNGHFFCDCFWGRLHSYTDDLCAHALAVKLAVEKENKP